MDYQSFSKVVGALIHPNARDTSKAMLEIEETSGAQEGLYFVPTARLGGNQLDSVKAKLEAQRESVRLGDAAPPPEPEVEVMPLHITGFRSPSSSLKSSTSAEVVGFSSENSGGGARAGGGGGGSGAGAGSSASSSSSSAAPAASAAAASAAAAAPAQVLAPVSIEALEDRMRKLLGRGWVHAAADIKRQARHGGKAISSEALRDVLAEKGVPLTGREVNALASRYSSSAGGSGSVDVDGLLTNAFKASFAGAAPPAKRASAASATSSSTASTASASARPSAATARLAASAQSAASTARPSAFVKPGGSKVGIF